MKTDEIMKRIESGNTLDLNTNLKKLLLKKIRS